MKYLKKILLLLTMALALLSVGEARASHVAGVDITYECVGQDSFLITVNVFRDCDGINWSATNITIDLNSPCGGSSTATLNTTNQVVGGSPVPIEVSQLCPTAVSSCNNGSEPGMELYTYQGIVVLNPPCNSWEIGFQPPCCRNSAILNVSSSSAYTYTTLNNVADSCNNSPKFDVSFPNPYSCVGQQVCYDYGVIEPDGDSLVYSLDTAYQSAGTPAAYNNPYTATQPIQGSQLLTIDPTSGKVQFTPNQAGSYVVVIRVCEYDRQTQALLGCVRRDMQFVVDNCTNQSPSLCTGDSITNPTGSGVKIGPKTVEVCYGQNFSFDIEVSDPDVSDSLIVTSNIGQVLPGATLNVNHAAGGNPVTATVSWTATIGANPFNTFRIQVSDDACPITSTNTSTFNVKVIPSTYAGEDQQICKGVESAQLNAIGGSLFTWSVIQGDQNSLSCTNCQNPVATPNTTTIYEVTSNLSQTCKNRDTVMVIAATNYTLNMTDDTLICYNDATIPIGAFPSINRNFSYQWSPSGKLSNDSIQTPNATPFTKTTFDVTTTSDSGCIKTGSVTVDVTPPFPTGIQAKTLSGDTVSCQGVPIELDVNLANLPASCGPTTNPCSGVLTNSTLGSGTSTNTANGPAGSNAWPTPYGGDNQSVRHQFLIRASELASFGIGAGTMNGLAFDVDNTNGTSTYGNFEIKIGCTPDSAFGPGGGSYWFSGLSTVFSPKTVNLSNGWNLHSFDTKYDYDGSSNLIVEVCFSNSSSGNNASVQYSNTSFGSSLYYFGGANACGISSLIAPPVNKRPNMKFEFCGGPDPASFHYSWSPTNGLDSAQTRRPEAVLSDSITYTVAVRDTFNRCFDTSSIKLFLTTIEVKNDTAVCPDVPFQLYATGETSCVGVTSYKWNSTSPTAQISDDTISNPTATITETTIFTVTYEDDCNCSITDSVIVTKAAIDSFDVMRNPPSCGEANGVMQLRAFGGVRPYQFSIDTGNTFYLDSTFGGLDNDYYGLMVKDAGGCFLGKIDTFTNTAPIINGISWEDLTCYQSQDGEVVVDASEGIQPLTYSVDSGTTYISSDTTSNLPAGDMWVVVKSNDGCTTKPEMVTLTQPDSLYFELHEDSVVTCYGMSDARLRMVPYGGTLPYTYSWTGSTSTDSIADSLASGNYTAMLTDANNCYTDSTYFVDQPDSLQFDSITFKPITCHGYGNGIFEIFVQGGNDFYAFSIDSGNTYEPNQVFDSITPGTYEITVKDFKNCKKTTYETVTEPDPLVINPTFDSTRICVSNCVEVSAPYTGGNPGPVTYFWSPSHTDTSFFEFCPEEDSDFIVYAKDVKNCVSNIEEIAVNLYDSLEVNVTQDTHICNEFGIPITAYPSGGDGNGYNYSWTPYPGLNNPTAKSPFATPSQATTYTVELTDNCGSPAVYDSVFVDVFPMPQVQFSADVTEGCQQQLINFYNDSDIGFNCQWTFGDGTTGYDCNQIAHPYTEPGFYNVELKVVAPGGCTDSLTKGEFIRVHPNPVADFSMSPQPASLVEPEVSFTDLSVGDIAQWEWNFGSFGSSDKPNPVVEYPVGDTATVPVRLAVTTTKGCYADTVKYSSVDVNVMIYAPKGFTPNGDGLNDKFQPQGMGMNEHKYTLRVFDRWGNMVYETEDPSEGWNGKLQSGENAPVGVYVWKLVVGDYNSKRDRHELVGNVALMR